MDTGLIPIGAFSSRCRLSAKALRLYDRLGLVVPVRVDPETGYRWYAPDQAERARLVGLLRRLDMPLAAIAEIVDQPPDEATAGLRAYLAATARAARERSALADHAYLLLSGSDRSATTMSSYEVQVRSLPARAVLSGTRRAHEAELGAILGELLAAMRAAGPGLPGIEGCPYVSYFADVSQDSDGPVEIVRPMAELSTAQRAAHGLVDVQARVEPGHDEAFVRLTMGQTRGSAAVPALAALEAFVTATGRVAVSPPRQVMIADWRTARADDPACDLAVVVHA